MFKFQIPNDSVLVTVTGRNLKPYLGLVMVYATGAPYVVLNSFSLLDTTGGNGDFVVNPGEDIEIPVWVKNWGDSTAYNLSGTMRKTSRDPYFSLDDTIKYFGNLGPLDSAYTSDNGYNVIIAPNCPDNHQINLQLKTKDTNDSAWISGFNFIVHAPIILLHDHYFPGNLKYTTAGDTNQLIVELENIGSYKAENATAKIISNDSLLNVIDSVASFGTIASDSIGSNQANPFVITTDPETPIHHLSNITLIVTAGVYIDTLQLAIYVGQKDYLIWDPDPNHSSGPIIKSKLESLDFSGEYTTTFPYGLLSIYKSLFVCVGVSPNKYLIADTSQASQEIEYYLESSGGKVYLEGGDVWYADPHYYHGFDFSCLFCILPRSGSIGPGSWLSYISGINSTFTQSMRFNYSGEEISLDRIDAIFPGTSIFRKNSSNDTIIGVAANNRTVGLSFELGGLTDTIPPSTKLVLIDSIMKYFGIPPAGIKETQIFETTNNLPSLVIYPNPCRERTEIRFQMPDTRGNKQEISLKIYDVTGRVVKSFNLASNLLPLASTISWDGIDDQSRKVSEGVYFVSFATSDYHKTEKVILIK